MECHETYVFLLWVIFLDVGLLSRATVLLYNLYEFDICHLFRNPQHAYLEWTLGRVEGSKSLIIADVLLGLDQPPFAYKARIESPEFVWQALEGDQTEASASVLVHEYMAQCHWRELGEYFLDVGLSFWRVQVANKDGLIHKRGEVRFSRFLYLSAADHDQLFKTGEF